MDDQVTYMKITTDRSKDTNNNIKQIVRVFTSKVFNGKLSNNGVFSLPLTLRTQVQWEYKEENGMLK